MGILAANGDWFYLGANAGCTGANPTFQSNAFDDAGAAAPGEVFVAYGGLYVTEYAATNLGSIFRRQPCGWERVGALPAGPTSARPESWGRLKAVYR
jgi:hypothetical protein